MRNSSLVQNQLPNKMHIETHHINGLQIAILTSDNEIISSVEDGSDLLGNLYYQGFDGVLMEAPNISPAFFDLKNGMAGEILQKFSNYRVRLAVVGEYAPFSSKSWNDFMYESNKGGHISFVSTKSEAIAALSKV